MPSKTSKPPRRPQSLWKAEPTCSEQRTKVLAHEFASELGPRDWVLLEGPMGAGKSTFARAVLEALGVHQPPEGSPTFAIAHEYNCSMGDLVHIDFYRLKSELEIEEAGIPAYFWERDSIVLAEWASLFEGFSESLATGSDGHRVWKVSLEITSPAERKIEIHLCS